MNETIEKLDSSDSKGDGVIDGVIEQQSVEWKCTWRKKFVEAGIDFSKGPPNTLPSIVCGHPEVAGSFLSRHVVYIIRSAHFLAAFTNLNIDQCRTNPHGFNVKRRFSEILWLRDLLVQVCNIFEAASVCYRVSFLVFQVNLIYFIFSFRF